MRPIVTTLILLCIASASFIAGRMYEHITKGYYYTVNQRQSVPFLHGKLELLNANESVGSPFLTPETSIIQLSPLHGLQITLYKAQRIFQENSPHVTSITTELNTISWTDNINNYRLAVDPIHNWELKANSDSVKIIENKNAEHAPPAGRVEAPRP